MNDRELMKLALEALDWAAGCIEPRKPHNCDCPVCVASDALLQRLTDNTIHSCSYYCERPDCVKAQRDELRERLAQPEQEPVVWMYQDKSTHEVRFQKHMRGFVDHGATYETPLYTTPPRREWVGLTLEEIFDCTAHITRIQKDDWVATDSDLAEFAHVIEAKLKEKNS